MTRWMSVVVAALALVFVLWFVDARARAREGAPIHDSSSFGSFARSSRARADARECVRAHAMVYPAVCSVARTASRARSNSRVSS